MGKTKIEWAEYSWNPIRALLGHPDGPKIGWHCEHVSEGCRNCYAENINMRLGTGRPFKPTALKPGPDAVNIYLDEKMLTLPLRWKRPRMVFVCSMTDLFADFVADEWIDRIMEAMGACEQHVFQVLTKRSARMREYLSSERAPKAWNGRRIEREAWPARNVWWGVSAERQQEADARIPDLLATPAAVRFLSAEPLLGPIDLTKLSVAHPNGDRLMKIDALKYPEARLDWVIVGGESGRGARPMHPDWARSLRDQCTAAGVAFFFKQWGEWAPPLDGEIYDTSKGRAQRRPAFIVTPDGNVHCFHGDHTADGVPMLRVGKKAAGRLLDGREWNEMPGADAPQREAEMA